MTTYHATVSLDGRFWFVEVAELGHATQARHLGEVETMARDLIAVMTETDPNSFDVELETKLPEGAAAHWRRSQQLRAESERANSEAAQEARLAARALKEQGLALREIGRLLGVSHQRAGQLVNGA